LVAGGQTSQHETEIYDPVAGIWSSGPPLIEGRWSHSATRLTDDRVLVTGTLSGVLVSEILDAAATTWTATMTRPATSGPETATLLADGRVLLIGGYPFSATPVIYDPAIDTWVNQKDMLVSRRNGQVSTLLQDGRVLISGGAEGAFFPGPYLSSTEIFDPTAHAWEAIGGMKRARTCHTASLLGSGELLVLSGLGADNSGERLNLGTGRWTAVHPSPGPGRAGLRAVTLADGRILTVGGSRFDQGGVPVSTAEVFDPVADSWTIVDAMHEARSDHAVARLADGRVLVASGHSETVALSNAEIFDPTSGTWTLTGPMVSNRYNASAFVLTDGRIVVVGGDPSGQLGAETLDLSMGAWTALGTTVPDTGSTTATLLVDNRILVAGNPDARLFDPSTGSWSLTEPTSLRTGVFTATRLSDGHVLVVGGDGHQGGTPSTSQVFDPSTGHWSNPVELGSDRKCHTATRLADGRVVVTGGDWGGDGNFPNERQGTTEIYDPAADRWSPVGTMHRTRYRHTTSNLPDGRLLVAGGSTQVEVTASSEIFDPASDSWTDAPSMNTARYGHSASVLTDGRVLVAGGFGADGVAVGSTELYNPASRTWTPAGDLNQPRERHAAVVLADGRVLVAGGGGPGPLSSAELYDPATGSWSTVAPMALERGTPAMARIAGGRVLVVGGRDAPDQSAELFDLQAGTWSAAAPLSQGRFKPSMTTLRDGRVLVAGGTPYGVPSQIEIYTPASNSWETVASLPTDQYSISLEALASTMPDGRVLVSLSRDVFRGGMTTGVYDPENKVLSLTRGPRTGHDGGTSNVLSDGRVLYVGGSTGRRFATLAEAFGPKGNGPGPTPVLSVAITAPDHLTTNGTEYSPNPFDVVVRVSNGGSGASEDSVVNLYLPPGFAFVSGVGQAALGSIAGGSTGKATFSVRANGVSTDRVLRLVGVATSSNSARASGSADVHVPGIFSILRFTPTRGGNAGMVTINILGSGFTAGDHVLLDSTNATDVTFVSPEWITARFDLTGANAGPRHLAVVRPNGARTEAAGTYEVVEAIGQPDVSIDVLTPSFVRVRTHELLTRVPFIIISHNNGLNDVDNIDFPIVFEPADRDGTPHPDGAPVQAKASSSSGQQISFGIPSSASTGPVPAGRSSISTGAATGPTTRSCVKLDYPCYEKFRIANIQYRVVLNALLQLQQLKLAGAIACVLSPVITPYPCAAIADAFAVEFFGLVAQLVLYRQLMKEYKKCLEDAGVPIVVTIPNLPSWTFNSLNDAQQYLKELLSQYGAGALGLGAALGLMVALIESIPLDDPGGPPLPPKRRRTLTCEVGSRDPNEKVGSLGSGSEGYLRDDEPLAYAIFFENQPGATAPAQTVEVVDALDPTKYDLGSFELGPVIIGDRVLVPPSGARQWTTDVDLRPERNLVLRVNAGLDGATGVVTWRFVSLDPATTLPPDDPLAGFLPPNVNPPEGDGSVTYTVRPKAGLTSGAELRNLANIIFDQNPPIDTPTWVNTIDNTAPEVTFARTPGNAEGWAIADVVVTPTCTDAHSGIDFCADPVTISADVKGLSVPLLGIDRVGNETTKTVSDINVDKTAPSLTASAKAGGSPYTAGTWSKSDVTVTFTCTDNLSGVATVTAPVTLGEGMDQTASGTCTDVAGNSVSTTFTDIDVDRTLPNITATATTAEGAYTPGTWTKSSVTVTFACTDSLSTVASVTEPIVVTAEGADQTATGTCTDKAGNVATLAFGDIDIDRTPPVTSIDARRIPFLGALAIVGPGLRLALTGTATDNVSGVSVTEVTFVNVLTGRSSTVPAVCTGGCGTTSARWEVKPSELSTGLYRVTAISTDAAANVGSPSPTVLVALLQIPVLR